MKKKENFYLKWQEKERNINFVLSPLGFEKEGKYWILEDANIAIEVTSGPLAGSWDKVNEVEIEGTKSELMDFMKKIKEKLGD